jgi:hypothetical protein
MCTVLGDSVVVCWGPQTPSVTVGLILAAHLCVAVTSYAVFAMQLIQLNICDIVSCDVTTSGYYTPC